LALFEEERTIHVFTYQNCTENAVYFLIKKKKKKKERRYYPLQLPCVDDVLEFCRRIISNSRSSETSMRLLAARIAQSWR
jgi:hypothetical protein